jgi:predicted  nucleic acid-binding Zn-ribbon protein
MNAAAVAARDAGAAKRTGPTARERFAADRARLAEASRRAKMHGYFAGVKLSPDRITYRGEAHPPIGVTATVETSGEVESRISATRLAATGVLALAWRKRTDNREVVLTVQGDGFAWIVDVGPDRLDKAREFAAKIRELCQ